MLLLTNGEWPESDMEHLQNSVPHFQNGMGDSNRVSLREDETVAAGFTCTASVV